MQISSHWLVTAVGAEVRCSHIRLGGQGRLKEVDFLDSRVVEFLLTRIKKKAMLMCIWHLFGQCFLIHT